MKLQASLRLWMLVGICEALVLTGSGCAALLGVDKIERPNQEDIVHERGVVRAPDPNAPRATGPIGPYFYMDRIRYLEVGDPYNVNRIVLVSSGELRPLVESFKLQVGDTVVVSTKYQGLEEAYQYSSSGFSDQPLAPQWPGHNRHIYSISSHVLQKIEKVGH